MAACMPRNPGRRWLPILLLAVGAFAGCTAPSEGPTDTAPPPPAGDPMRSEPVAATGSANPDDVERSAPAPALHLLVPGVRVQPASAGRPGRVEIDAVACLDSGWLEQIACAPGTREHEALLVVDLAASELHAALLLAGFEPGAPGRWKWTEPDGAQFVAPQGSAVRLRVRRADAGAASAVGIDAWIRDHDAQATFPDAPFVFGGSRFVARPDGTEVYAADLSGSLVGLATFGDETIGFSLALTPEEAIAPPEWVVDESAVPPMGTPVVLIIEAWAP